MKKTELIRKVALVTDQTIEFTTKFFHTFENELIDAIKRDGKVVLSEKIGKFVLKSRKERTILIIKDQKEITIPARTVVTFKVSETIKNIVKDINLNELN